MSEKPNVTVRKLTDYKPNPRNHNKGSERGSGMIEHSFRTFGAGRSLLADRNGILIAGNQSQEGALNAGIERVIEVETTGNDIVVVKRTDLDLEQDERAVLLSYADNRTHEVSFELDAAQLKEDRVSGIDFSGLWTDKELDALTVSKDEDTEDGETLTRHDVPDALWATDNEWGVPLLDSTMQADALDLPIVQWARGGVKSMRGTWHFYTEDAYFEALWTDPSPIVNTGAITAIEPNFSTNEHMPKAVSLWQIYRKRWMARWWQARGVRIIVDCNVAPTLTDIEFLGVPRDWRAFATRWYSEAETVADYERACAYIADMPKLFVVYAGGKDAQAYCKKRGWIWIDGSRDAVLAARSRARNL